MSSEGRVSNGFFGYRRIYSDSVVTGGDEGPVDDIEDGKMTCLADVAQMARAPLS